jgi:O-antigen/teichoic acid export membrane protein
MLAFNSRANVMVGALALPLLAFAFAFAEDVVTLVFTARYVEAAPVMRVYILGLVVLVVELASLTFLLQQGGFVLRLAIGALALSVTLSLAGAHAFGLAGAAAGSTAAVYLDLAVTLRRLSKHTGVPVRRLQDWRALGLLAAFAALGAALAWALVAQLLPGGGALARLASGALLQAAVYCALALSWPRGRGWLAAVR